MFKLVFEKAEEPEIKLPTSAGSGKRKRVPEKHLLLLYWLCQSICVDHNKLWKILKEMGIPDHLTYFLRNLYAGQEATVRTGHGTTDWFQIGKGVHPCCILSPCLFNLYAEYIMRQSTSWGREGNGIPLQYSCLENPMDGEAWWAAVHGVAKSRKWLSDFTFTFHFNALEKEMATTLGWKKHKLESRLPGEISITSDMQMTPLLWQKVKRN